MSLCMHLLQVFLPTFILAVSFLCLMLILDSILAVSSQYCALPHWFQKVYSIRPGLPIGTVISPQTGLCTALLSFSHYFPTDPLSFEVRTFRCHNSPICKVSDYSSFSYSLRTSVLSLVFWGSWGYTTCHVVLQWPWLHLLPLLLLSGTVKKTTPLATSSFSLKPTSS